MPSWEQLFPREQARILRLLIERVTSNPTTRTCRSSSDPVAWRRLRRKRRHHEAHHHVQPQRKRASRPVRTRPKGETPKPAVAPAAHNLARAHYLDRLIERGVIADYTQAARMLSVSQARMTHVMGLLMLAPAIQEAILATGIFRGDKELRELTRINEWKAQLERISS